MASGKKATFCRYPELKKQLDIHGITIPKAAEIVGCKAQAFSNHLNGKHEFKLSEAIKLADAIGMPVEKLFKEETR